MRRGRRREIAKESKKVRDGLEEQQWRMKEMEEGREASRKSCDGKDKDRGGNSFVSVAHSPLKSILFMV